MLKIKCDRCYNELDDPGALVFSPPVSYDVKKFHICNSCWFDLREWIEE